MLVSDSHFVLLPSSLVLPAVPVIDAGSTQCPTPAPTARNVFGTQPVLYGSAELCGKMHWSYSEGREPCHSGVHMKGGGLPVLRGGTRRTWIWGQGGPGADTGVHIGCTLGAHVHSGAVAQLRKLCIVYAAICRQVWTCV
ncbi:hypothetical protein B0H14DRAFT_2620551 [Mycena olivaceomarginata]|nr:hypothetical protein B0H14DRAFT_2620551 [Mycena olivaceomarginata]